jgi:hypothetical protein
LSILIIAASNYHRSAAAAVTVAAALGVFAVSLMSVVVRRRVGRGDESSRVE